MSQWYTFGDCKCDYAHGDDKWPSNQAPVWMEELGDILHRMLGIDTDKPDSCNCNMYPESTSSLGWHSDNETLFVKNHGKATIISFSLGAARVFEFRRKNLTNSGPPPQFCSLGHFDVSAMMGKMQLFFEHRVPQVH